MEMDLKNIQWGEFKFIDIFEIKNGFYNKKPIPSNKGRIPFLGATQNNNGITEFYTLNEIESNSKIGYGKNEPLNKKIYEGNCIAVTNNGSVGFAYYQVHKFTCSHDVNPLYLKNNPLNFYLANFLIAAIEKQKVCFEYARKWRPIRMVKSKLLLPVNLVGKPDYVFMEQYMRQKEQEKLEKFTKYLDKRIEEVKDFQEVEPFNQKEWGEFEIGKLFRLHQGKSKGLNHLKKSEVGLNYLGATNSNNGVLSSVQTEGNEKMIQKGNCIAFIRNGEGSMGFSIYKAEKFIATSDISVGYSQHLNRQIGLFITTIADKVRGKYNFGYKRNDSRLKKEKLQLPVNSKGQPDYEYMENYIKKIEYQKLTKYKENTRHSINKYEASRSLQNYLERFPVTGVKINTFQEDDQLNPDLRVVAEP